jgi:Zeta toxin
LNLGFCSNKILFPCLSGAGKTHTINKLNESGQFPLESFIRVDPDEIRRRLPEFQIYLEKNPEKAGELTRKEAGMMAEILTSFALEQGLNVLVDGSLKDAAWYGRSQHSTLTPVDIVALTVFFWT